MQLPTSSDNSPVNKLTDERKQRIWFIALALGLGFGISITSGQKQPVTPPGIHPNTHAAGTMITRIEAQPPRNFVN